MRLARNGAAVALAFATFALAGRTAQADRPARMEIAVADGAFTDLPQGSPLRNAAFDRAKALGATYIRGFLAWVRQPVYDDSYPAFAMFDSFVDEATGRGFQVELSLMGFASEQYGGPDRSGVDPDPLEYGRFVAACASHFGTRVQRYSIWNEPNLPVFLMPASETGGFVGALGPPANPAENYKTEILPKNAARYRELCQTGYATIKAIAPGATVLVGELSSSHDPFAFLEAVAPVGTCLVADGFALHPYQFLVAPTAPPGRGSGGGISRVAEFQTLLAKLASEKRLTTTSGEKLPLYLTEFGYQQLEGRTFQSVDQIPEATRAAWLPEAFEVAREAGARQMLYFMLLPPAPSYPWDTSILDAGGNPLPSYTALERWSRLQGY